MSKFIFIVDLSRSRSNLVKLLVCSLLLVGKLAYAQKSDPDLPIYNPLISSPSPNAAKLGVYGDVPVSLFSGTLDLTIPIYEIRLPDFTLPIKLSYNASGIKVGEVATDVGLGWVLNAGGTVASSVRGRADMLPNRFIPADISKFDPNDRTITTPGGTSSYDMAMRIIDHNYDTEQDIYYYNFANYTGKFIYSNDLTRIIPIPYTNLRIERPYKIVDAQGNIFEFEVDEQSGIDERCAFGDRDSRRVGGEGSITRMLTRILTSNGHEIKFAYERVELKYPVGTSETRYISPAGVPGSQCESLASKDRLCTTINQVNQQRLIHITVDSSDIVVNFVYDTVKREDLALDNMQYGNRLASIEVLNNQKSIKKITFQHGYFRSRTDYNNLSIEDKGLNSRLKLLSVYEEGKGAYVFSYNETYNMPNRLSFAQDDWGYYNSVTNNSTLLPKSYYTDGRGADRESRKEKRDLWMLTGIKYPTGGSTLFVYEPHVSREQVTRTEIINKTLFFFRTSGRFGSQTFYVDNLYYKGLFNYILSDGGIGKNVATVTAPNGDMISFQQSGQTPYAFSKGTYNVEITSTTTNNKSIRASADVDSIYHVWEDVPVGGVRIAKVTDLDISGNTINTYYNYNLPDTNISSAVYFHRHSYSKNEFRTRKIVNVVPVVCNYFVLSASALPELGSDASEQAVGYKYVTITKDSARIWGRVRNRFSVDEKEILGDIKNNSRLDWCRGLNLETSSEKYDSLANKWYPVEKKINYYRTNFNPTDDDTPRYVSEHEEIIPSFKLAYAMPENVGGFEYYFPAEFFFNVFRYVSGWVRLDSSIQIFYSDVATDSLQKSFKYNYNNYTHVQPTEIYSADSKGNGIKTKLMYPHDFQGNNVYDTMVKRNNIVPVIERDIYKADKLVKMNKNEFALFNSNNLTLPAVVKEKNGENPLEVKARFYRYGNKGNLLEASNENDIHYSYLWGYNENYLVASVMGSDYNTVQSFITNKDILKAPTTDQLLRSELNNIRTGLMNSNALVKTYTYSPLIGMTSETDSAGKTIYYEYDIYGRLKDIKDLNGKILKHFDYQYLQPITQ